MTTEQAQTLIELMTTNNQYLQYVTGFALFAVIVVICHYSYKFFKMFF